MKLKQSTRGFTLIELLVVVAIIALLAAGAFPVFSKVLLEAKAKSTMRNAYQIHTALFAYSQNHDQEFPSTRPDGGEVDSANDAYRQLFVAGLVDDEKIFHVQGCEWSNKKPDGDIGSPEDNYSKAIEGGENHWGYVTKLTSDRDDSKLPIIMDGGTESQAGKWTREPKEKGGVWKGKYAIAVRIGGNAKVYELDNTLTVKDKKDGQDVDIFSDQYGTTTSNVKNPASS